MYIPNLHSGKHCSVYSLKLKELGHMSVITLASIKSDKSDQTVPSYY